MAGIESEAVPNAHFPSLTSLVPNAASAPLPCSPHNRLHPIRIMLNNARWSLMDYKYKGGWGGWAGLEWTACKGWAGKALGGVQCRSLVLLRPWLAAGVAACWGKGGEIPCSSTLLKLMCVPCAHSSPAAVPCCRPFPCRGGGTQAQRNDVHRGAAWRPGQ